METAGSTGTDLTSRGSADPASSSTEEGKGPPPGQQALSPSPINVAAAVSNSNSSTESVDIAGKAVLVVAGNTHIEGDVDSAFSHVMGVYSTKSKALARVKQSVRECPPQDPDQEEDLHEDDPRSKAYVESFVNDPADWKMVLDPLFAGEKGIGYQYANGGLRHATWIEKVEVG